MIFRAPLPAVVLAVCSLALSAQTVPSTINYQGRLTDNSPTQVPLNASMPMAFAIWDDPVAGTKLWQEPAAGGTSVTVVGGIFSIALGSNGAPLPASVFSGATSARYLEITLNPGAGNQEILAPRQLLSITGYAARAQASVDSDALGGVASGSWQRSLASNCSGSQVLTGFTQSGTPACATPDSAPGNWRLAGNAGTTPGTHFLGTTDAQNLVFKTGGTPWMTLSTAGNLGIGASVPQSRLHLDGGAGVVFGQFTNVTTGSTAGDGVRLGVSNTGDGYLQYNEPGHFWLQQQNATALVVGSGGHLGLYSYPDAAHSVLVGDTAANNAIGVDNIGVTVGDVDGNQFGNYLLVDYNATPRFLFMGANIGVGTTNPGEQLDLASGNVRIAAANDYKYAGPKTHYYAAPAAAFNPEATTYARALISGNVYLATGSAVTVGYLQAPVHLPDGAIVTALTCYVVDNDGTYNPQTCVLRRNDGSTSTSYGNDNTMAVAPAPATTNSSFVQLSTTTAIAFPAIDNLNYAYYLRWGTQQANSNLRLNKMVIAYTVTKVD